MFPEPTVLLFIGCFIKSVWTQDPNQYIDTKNQLADILTKEIPHVMNGIIFCVCLTEVMSKKNAKKCRWRKSHSKIGTDDEFSFAMQRKDSWCDCLYCIRKPGKIRHESQLPLSSWNEQHQRTRRLVLDAYSSDYSEWNAFSRVEIWWTDGVCSQSTRTNLFLMTMIWTLTQSQNQTCR